MRKYIDTILEPKLLLSIEGLFPSNAFFIFQQYSAPFDTAKNIKKLFSYKYFWAVFIWLETFFDLTPIEKLRLRLKTLVRIRRPSNKKELIEAIINSWHYVITKEELKLSSIRWDIDVELK